MSTPTKTVDLIGAPTDVGAAHRGASMGPEAMRVAGIQQTLAQFGVSVNDLGNLAGPPNPWLPPVDGYRHLPEVQAWNQAVHDAVYGSLSGGRLPILLGGDHCLAIGSISAVARHCRDQGLTLRVLWLDAHADFNTMGTTPTGNIHGMPVAILRGMGPVELTSIGGRTPAIDAGTVRQIGIRSVDVDEKRLVHEDGMEVFDMRNIDEHGMRPPARELRRRLPRPDDRARGRDDGAGRPDLSGGPVGHGDDRGQRPARLARRHGAQPGQGPRQPDRRGGDRPHRLDVRQEHAAAPQGHTRGLIWT